ncbi:MAG TPA: DinB family protein [Bryobacteraceae bacterium]
MSISETILNEFDHEMANTRKMLERVPQDRLGWRPHPKSWNMGGLATHVANIPSWTTFTIQDDSFDYAPPGAPPFKNPEATSTAELLEIFDKNVTSARAAIAGASDEHLGKPWSLLAGGQTIFTMPRTEVLRSMIMNHGIHHRAHLGLYLRLNDVAVPGMYGPSADEM